MKLLLIEDSPEIVNLISMTFKLRWPETSIISTPEGAKGIELVESESPDVVILDINLPDMEGFDVLQQVRLFSDVPVLILTVRGDEMDRVRGLEIGADDYIVKPFSALELLSRVNSALRRSSRSPATERMTPIVSGGLTIDFHSKEVLLDGEPVHLTPTEYNILYHLVRNEGKFINNSTLQQWIWGEAGNVDSSVVRRYVYQLRAKLKDNPPKMLVSEAGKGYKFVRPMES